MKNAALPSIRIEPQLRAELEAVLAEGESLSSFVESTVRKAVEHRRVQADFMLAAKLPGKSFSARACLTRSTRC